MCAQNEQTGNFSIDKDGNIVSLIIKRGVSYDAIEYLKNNSKEQIDLFLIDGEYSDLEFLITYKNRVRSLRTSGVSLLDWNSINRIKDIVAFVGCEGIKYKGLDASAHKSLRWLDCYGDNLIENRLGDFSSLRSIRLRKAKSTKLNILKNISNLEHLSLVYSRNLVSLSGLEQFNKLKFLELESNNKLQCIESLDNCVKLSTLIIVKNHKLSDYTVISKLANINELILSAPKHSVDSLSWVRSLTKLRLFRFDIGITDGDVKHLYELRNLEHVYFRQKRNLNVKLKDIENYLLKNESEDSIKNRWTRFPHFTEA